MARLNIEDCWWIDPRRELLAQELGGLDQADIAAIKTWRIAQEFWKHGKLVPRELLQPDSKRFQALSKCGLVQEREEGIYVRGSSAYLSWTKEAHERGRAGGKKSAEVRKKKYGTAQPSNRASPERPEPPEAESKGCFGKVSNKLEALEPSVSVSGSYSDSNTKNKDKGFSATSSADALPRLGQIWNQSCKNLPKIRACASKRKKQAESRWKENPDEGYWQQVVAKLADSPFCNGKNDRHWKADFDFFLQPETQNKALEGKYDEKKTNTLSHDEIRLKELREQAAREEAEARARGEYSDWSEWSERA